MEGISTEDLIKKTVAAYVKHHSTLEADLARALARLAEVEELNHKLSAALSRVGLGAE